MRKLIESTFATVDGIVALDDVPMMPTFFVDHRRFRLHPLIAGQR